MVNERTYLNEYRTTKSIMAKSPITSLEIVFKSRMKIVEKSKSVPIVIAVKYSTNRVEYIFNRPIRPKLV